VCGLGSRSFPLSSLLLSRLLLSSRASDRLSLSGLISGDGTIHRAELAGDGRGLAACGARPQKPVSCATEVWPTLLTAWVPGAAAAALIVPIMPAAAAAPATSETPECLRAKPDWERGNMDMRELKRGNTR